ncbi:SpoIID/LytB domain-containing protein [Altericista sp. CCNU0014]|uniref:SpoIID/LytB domain-containing protein n=1 Tax=Altericista sp. CCNU0014 TaxID=3082949 RepID=UPI00384A6F66
MAFVDRQTLFPQGMTLGYFFRFQNRAMECVAAGALVSTGIIAMPGLAAPLNPEIKVGIEQRFGQQPKDRLVLQAQPGDRLTLKFWTSGKPVTAVVEKLQVDIAQEPLSAPREDERLVISTHRSYESAETSAKQWRAKGYEVEIAQPENWQVWAKRDRYDSTVSRLLLQEDLKSKGLTTSYIDRKTLTARPTLSWEINGYRYNRRELEITAAQNVIQVGNQSFGGRLRFQPNAYGSYTLVNQVPVETYLRGVVPHEIGSQAPETAVQAQTILARTYALRNLRRFKVDGYELCATTQCQVYEGLSGATPVSDRAIATTTGQVLTYGNELIDALYSSTTGGVTAAFEDVWEGTPRPYLKAKIDAYPNRIWDLNTRNLSEEKTFRAFIGLQKGFNEDGWDYLRWKVAAPLKQVNQNLREFLKKQQHPLTAFSTIQNLQVVERSRSGRVQRLRVTTDLGAIDLAKDEILRAFEAPNSLLFYVEPVADAKNPKVLGGFTFVGGGLGHAVGLSQAGSYALSKQGWSAAKILSFYYPNTSLQPLSSTMAFWKDTALSPSPSIQQAKTEGEEGFQIFGWKFPKLGLGSILEWFQSLTA